MVSPSSLKVNECVSNENVKISKANLKLIFNMIESILYIILSISIFYMSYSIKTKASIIAIFIANSIIVVLAKENLTRVDFLKSILNFGVAILCMIKFNTLENAFSVIFALYITMSAIIEAVIMVIFEPEESNKKANKCKQITLRNNFYLLKKVYNSVDKILLYTFLIVLLVYPIFNLKTNSELSSIYFLLLGIIYVIMNTALILKAKRINKNK